MFDDIKDYIRQFKVYALGKGLLTLAVFGAGALGAATGIGVLIPATVIAVGGFALTVVRRLHSQMIYEENMVDLYRDNIAATLSVAPADVTRADLKEAARTNEIINEALKRQHKKTLLTIATAALSGAVSIGLIMAFGFDQTLKGLADTNLKGALEPLAGFVGVGTVASLSNMVVHEGLDAIIGYGTGIHKAAAHDLIYKMDLQIQRGKPISREEVFGVVVAADHSLQERIIQKFKKPYAALTHGEKSHLLHEFNLARTMDNIALAISDKKVRPGYLAFAAHDPRISKPQLIPPATDTAPQPTTASFVSRLNQPSRDGQMSHVEQLAARDAGAQLLAR
ncbi:MAG: hypothetical protein ACOYNL_00640 [Rickettsiales bacterium]